MPKYAAYHKDDPHSYALGIFPSMELLRARPNQIRALLVQSLKSPGEGLQKLIEACGNRGFPIEEAPKALQRISGKENCHAALVFEKYEAAVDPSADHVLLHNPSDAGNAGTILRSALGFGYRDLLIVRPGIDPFDPRVVRASMGAVFHLNIAMLNSFEEYSGDLDGRELFFFRLRNADPLESVLFTLSAAPRTLVFGNEASGLPPELERPGRGVLIEHSGQIDSLNLSVAAGIGLYAFRRSVKPDKGGVLP
ncbi:MAG: TrmH family RNA methyltransferase [Christensenellaceae bacterium]|jgi:TrmH family RNA methyltransferase|nr:TrmH family RNA methyltransferase [Christensenellaceae bacterium]